MSRWTEYRERVWRELSEARGGRLVPRESWTKPAYGAASVVGGYARIDSYYVNKITYTRVYAPLVMRVGPIWWVTRQNSLGSLAKLLRLVRDVELGGGTPVGAEFDRRFVVKCQRVEETARMWTPDARRMALELIGRMELFRASYASIRSESTTVSVAFPETEMTFFRRTSPAYAGEVALALDLVDALSAYGIDILDRLRALPNAVYREPAPSSADPTPPRVELDTAHGLVRIWPAWQPWGLALAVSAASSRGLPPFAFDVEAGRVPASAPSTDVLVPAALEELRAVGHATLVSDGAEVRLFVDARLEGDRLLSAARAVGLLASGATSSAFR